MKRYSLHALTTNEALLLAHNVVRIAKASTAGKRGLHPKIAEVLARVQLTQKSLDASSRSREQEDDPLGSQSDSPKPHVPTLMSAVRARFAGLASVLRRLAELPADDTTGAKARAVEGALFRHGTGYLNGSAADLSVRCGRVLDRAREKTIAAQLLQIGCAPLVKAAAAALADLRESYDASACRPAEEPSGSEGLAKLVEATAALREYVVAVQAVDYADGTDLERELLAPLANRHVKRVKRAQRPVETTPTPAESSEADEAPPSRAA